MFSTINSYDANTKCLFASGIPFIGSIVSTGALFFYAGRVISSVSAFFTLKKVATKPEQPDSTPEEKSTNNETVKKAAAAAADKKTAIGADLGYMGLHFLNILTGGLSSGAVALVGLCYLKCKSDKS